MLTVRKMTLDDLSGMPDGIERQLYTGMLKQDLGPTLVIEDKKGVLCLCGCVIIWTGVGELWFKLVRADHLLSLMPLLRRLIKETAKEYGLWRLQACVEVGFKKGYRFAEYMGFKKEAVLKRHNYNGKDNLMYARLF